MSASIIKASVQSTCRKTSEMTARQYATGTRISPPGVVDFGRLDLRIPIGRDLFTRAMRALASIAAATLMLAACGGNKDEFVHVLQQPLQTHEGEQAGSHPPISVETTRPQTDGDGPLVEGARSVVGAPIIYSTTGGPFPDAERARHVRIGANVTPLPDWMRPDARDPDPNGIVISFGRTHEGARAPRVEEYLRAHIDDVWESQGYENEPISDTPGLASFPGQPVVRIAQGTGDEHTALTLHAVAVVNTALPWSKRILIGPAAPPLARIETIPDGQVFVDFASNSDWTTQAPGTAAHEPSYSFEYDRTSERWEIKGMRAGHVWVDPSGLGTQAELVRTLVHELVHALGLRGHPYIDQFPESLMRNAWPTILATDNHIPGIDADGLLAIYTRLAPGTEPDDLSATSLEPWENVSLRIHGELDIPGSASFGIAFRNDLARPWAMGPEPSYSLAAYQNVRGIATWDGALAGFTPEGRSVHGDVEISVDLGPLTGRADFDNLWEWSDTKWRSDGGHWSIWGDGDLGYSIAVHGNTFRETGGDEGILTGSFVGRQHEGAVGTLEREDISAAFGAELLAALTKPGACQPKSALQDCGSNVARETIDLTRYVTPAVQQGRAPGMIAAIVDGNGVRAIGAAGVRKFGSPDSFTVDDLVHLGSNTKAMTSTMLATMVADGTFSNGWETTIADVFPELLVGIHRDYHSVTLSQLVRMRGGIAPDAEHWGAYTENPDIAERRYAILRDNLANSPAGSVGNFLYSNLSYMIAGAMAEELTGQSWETLMEQRLFAPLGITTAGFGAPGTPDDVDQPWGHRPGEGGVWLSNQFDNPPALGPAGTVHMSVADWAKFISLWITNDEPAILDRDSLNELGIPTSGTYAAGWHALPRSWAEGIALTHDGTNTSWWSVLWIAPARGVAYLAVANSSDVFQRRDVYSALDSVVYSLIVDTDELTGNDATGGRGIALEQIDESGEAQQRLDPAAVRSLTGAALPAFSSQDVGESVSQLRVTANALLASDVLVLAGDGAPVRGQTACHGTTCSSAMEAASILLSADGVNFGSPETTHQAVASHRDVSLAQGQGKNAIAGTPVNYDVYGGWLQYSFFSTESGTIAEGLLDGASLIHSYSAGNESNSSPIGADGSGTWRGVMVGADVSHTETRGQPIQGDAEITIANFEHPEADVAFTRIFNLISGAARDDMTWTGISVIGGDFATGADGDSIEGRFYGPNHEEVGGVFERDEILGSFGTTRSMSTQ